MNGLGERSSNARRTSRRRPPEADGAEDVAVPSAARAVQVVVDAEHAGQRLDNYLIRIAKGVPKSHVYRIVRAGEVRVNGGRVDADRRLAAGDVVRIPPLRIATRAPRAAKREKSVAPSVVFEDDALLVVDKPAGVAVHGGSGLAFGVIEQLRDARPEARFLELVHRLDRETSGLLIVAKKRAALVALHAAWRDGRVAKRYTTLAAGAWPEATRQVRVPLVRTATADGERRVHTTVADDPDGMPAWTVFRPVERFEGPVGTFVLLDVALKTGRTHQIRVHLAHLGRPIVGDDKYGDFASNRRLAKAGARPRLTRMFLHAASLAFAHPLTGERMALTAPLPDDLAAFVDALRTPS